MAGADKSLESFACLFYLLTAHRARNVKKDPDRDRSIGVAEKCDLLTFAVVIYSKRVFG